MFVTQVLSNKSKSQKMLFAKRYCPKILVNVKRQSKVQTLVLGLGVEFVFPLSQEQEEEQPPPKYIRRGCT